MLRPKISVVAKPTNLQMPSFPDKIRSGRASVFKTEKGYDGVEL